MKRIRVNIMWPKDRKCWYLYWKHPITGKQKTLTSETTDKKEALRMAARKEAELEGGAKKDYSRLTWKEFRDRYTREKLPSLRKSTRVTYRTAMNLVEQIVDPQRLWAVDSDQISEIQAKRREQGYPPTTIKSNLMALKAVLGWADEMGMLPEMPSFIMPEDAEEAGGRPLAEEELDRMRDALRKNEARPTEEELKSAKRRPIVKPHQIEPLLKVMDGLWWGGLRTGESMLMHWEYDTHLCPDFSGKHPVFRIQARTDKGKKSRTFTMAPEFFNWLEENYPPGSRTGFVFNIPSRFKDRRRIETGDTLSDLIAEVGKAAGIKVGEIQDRHSPGKMKTVFASAHDFRRTFAERWIRRDIKPPVLMEMMRHKSLTTTMQYYATSNTQESAASAWRAFTNKSTNSHISPPVQPSDTPPKTA